MVAATLLAARRVQRSAVAEADAACTKQELPSASAAGASPQNRHTLATLRHAAPHHATPLYATPHHAMSRHSTLREPPHSRSNRHMSPSCAATQATTCRRRGRRPTPKWQRRTGTQTAWTAACPGGALAATRRRRSFTGGARLVWGAPGSTAQRAPPRQRSARARRFVLGARFAGLHPRGRQGFEP